MNISTENSGRQNFIITIFVSDSKKHQSKKHIKSEALKAHGTLKKKAKILMESISRLFSEY